MSEPDWDIKSCPFCTHPAPKPETIWPAIAGDRVIVFVLCPGCGARGPLDETKEEAIDAWNEALRLDD